MLEEQRAHPASLRPTLLAPLRVLALRALASADASWSRCIGDVLGLTLPGPGQFLGADPYLVWLGPTECWLISPRGERLEAVAQALRPGCVEQACAIDRSAGIVTFELQGAGIDALLARLVDASAIPRASGQATRARCIDVAVVLLRLDAQRLWLLGDRAQQPYLSDWLRYANEGRHAAGRN